MQTQDQRYEPVRGKLGQTVGDSLGKQLELWCLNQTIVYSRLNSEAQFQIGQVSNHSQTQFLHLDIDMRV